MPYFRVEGKVQVAVSIKIEADSPKEALKKAASKWLGLNDVHTGRAVGVFEDDETDPKICEDGSEPEWIEANEVDETTEEDD